MPPPDPSPVLLLFTRTFFRFKVAPFVTRIPPPFPLGKPLVILRLLRLTVMGESVPLILNGRTLLLPLIIVLLLPCPSIVRDLLILIDS